MFRVIQGRLLLVRLIMILASAALLAIGILCIYAVGHPAESSISNNTAEYAGFWKKQIIFACIGIIGFILVNLVNYRRFGELSYWIYGLVLFLLFVLLIAKVIPLPFVPMRNGTHRWIIFSIAGKQLPAIQPSELCKLAYVMALAWYLRYKSNYRNFEALLGPFVLTIVPMVLILLEPDLGTVILMMPIFFVLVFIAGARVKHLLLMILLAILVSPLMWQFMRPYQKMRICSVALQSRSVQKILKEHPAISNFLINEKFNETRWKSGAGFHLIRSKYAVKSGGLTGYGWAKGPFIKYDFLPEKQNDFIFAIIAHQWGFFGCLVVILLYAVIIMCGLEIANNNSDPFGKLLAVGLSAIITVEVLVNVSMTVGLMPITGLTLPLVSYGGSSLLISMLSIGLLNNIGRGRAFTVAPKRLQ